MKPVSDWKTEFRTAITTVEGLVDGGWVEPEHADLLRPVLKKYGLFLPRYYAELIDKSDPSCPIRLQSLPQIEELEAQKPGLHSQAPALGKGLSPNALPLGTGSGQNTLADPLGDLQHRPASRITHRYGNRALLHLTVNCPMYCRYCFRKSLLNEDSDRFFDGPLEEAFAYIEGTPTLEEVILSGGDPLMVTDPLLGQVLQRLSAVAHLKRIRIHSRAPVTMPSRVTEGLVKTLSQARLPLVVVTHFNHPREWTPLAEQACRDLRGVTTGLFNQSVLLRGVNNDAKILAELFEKIFTAGVIPYYLHQLDRARGTLHFEVPLNEAKRIFGALKTNLPGYLVPRFVQDHADALHKTWLES